MLNFFANCYELLRFLLLKLEAMYYKSYDLFSSSSQSKIQYDLAFLEQCKLELTKIPKHICVIIGPEESLSAELLSRIVVYALNLNIDFISFYDTRNTIEAEKEGITLKDLHPPKNISCVQIQEISARWSMSNSDENKNDKVSGSSNGYISNGMNGTKCKCRKETYIEVVMLSAKHGRPLIAEICRDLYKQRHTKDVENLLQQRALLMERIDSELKSRLNGISDPELGIIFHGHTCTFGVLPWQTRFTEFYTVETGRYFNVEMFAKVLYRYSRCEQRWGK